MTQKEQLAEAQTRITDLEGQNLMATETIKKLELTLEELTVKLTTAETKVSEQEAEISTLTANAETVAALLEAMTTSAETAENEVTQLEGKVAELQKSAKSVEELADARAREIASRCGTTLPAKTPGAGDKTIDGQETAGLRGMAKAVAYFKSRQPTPLTV